VSGKVEGVRVLVVDDAQDTVEVLSRNLASRGIRVTAAASAMEAIGVLDSSPIDLVITDFHMPGVDGMDLTRYVRENRPDTEVVMITGYGSIGNAVTAMKAGAGEYLTKPFTDKELFDAIERALDALGARRLAQGRTLSLPAAPQGLIGQSEAMRGVLAMIGKAASVSAPVLVSGESGTGKEMVARAIHYTSPRSSAPFVAVNCGAIPETLIESELFGHVKGAFTGADQSRAGYFQTAEGGTLFLDEIAETSPGMQVRLLRAIQDGEVAMVGSPKTIKVNARVIAATNKDLSGLVAKGLFREDLFYRLNVIPIEIPPLRERGDDLLLLLRCFTERHAREYGKAIPQYSDHALASLRRHVWPGNVRELENVVQRLVLLDEKGLIDAPDLPELMRFSAPRSRVADRRLDSVEAEYIAEVLAGVEGNKSRAAHILGIDRKTLAIKLRKYGISPER
jgi:two-component system response regulator HydG